MSRDSDIVDFLLGELPPDEREAFERRMRENPDLRREVERMRPVVAALEALPADAWTARRSRPFPTCRPCRPRRPTRGGDGVGPAGGRRRSPPPARRFSP